MTMAERKLWSLSALATELQVNVRTAARMLVGVAADGQLHGRDAWYLSTAIRAQREYGSDRLADRRLSGTAPPDLEKLERLARKVSEGLHRLRAADPSARLPILQDFGHAVGALDKALAQSAAREGSDAALVFEAFHDAVLARTVQEIVALMNPADHSPPV